MAALCISCPLDFTQLNPKTSFVAEYLSSQKVTKTTFKKMPTKFPENEEKIKKTYSLENVNRLCRDGLKEKALSVLNQLENQRFRADCHTYSQILKSCTHSKTLSEGKRMHAHIIKSGFERDSYVANCLLNMYAKCQSLIDARQVFDKMPQRNIVAWTAMLAGHAQNGHAEEALGIFKKMQMINMELDSYTFGSVIKACASIEDVEVGKQIHGCAIKTLWEPDVCVGTAFVDMYCKSGRVVDARKVLERMPQQDVISWTAMISEVKQLH